MLFGSSADSESIVSGPRFALTTLRAFDLWNTPGKIRDNLASALWHNKAFSRANWTVFL